MKKISKGLLTILLFIFAALQMQAQARLTIENKSQRSMTVKVMKGIGKGTLYKTVTIGSYRTETIYFSQSGQYFTKTKAVLKGKDPVYQKGQPFQITNNERGYSILTLTFSIKESSIPQITGGSQISKSEFDQN